MSWHRVQHTPTIVCRPFILTISSWPLNVASASGVPPSKSTASKYSSNLARSQPASASPNSLNHGLQVLQRWSHLVTFPQFRVNEPMNRVSAPGAPPTDRLQIDHLEVLLQSRSIIACYKCISRLAQSRPPSASPNSLDHGLPVHLQTRSITASKLARSRPPSAALTLLDLGLQVHLQTPSITASKCSSQFTRSRPPTASPDSIDHGLQVHLQTRPIMASKCSSQFTRSRPPIASPNWLDHGLKVHLWVHSTSASNCISNLARSRPRSVSLCCRVVAI